MMQTRNSQVSSRALSSQHCCCCRPSRLVCRVGGTAVRTIVPTALCSTHVYRGVQHSGSAPCRGAPAAAAAAAASPDDQLRSWAIDLARVADETKALDVSLLHVEPLVSWTSYMLILTVMSRPQLLAVLSRLEDAAAAHGLQKQNTAGSSQWELLDFGSIVCQVFTAEQRDHYALDEFYAMAEEVELPFTPTPAGNAGSSTSSAGPVQSQVAAAFDAAGSGGAGSWSKSL